jgi:proteasome lid subunit RPN8/RPN11
MVSSGQNLALEQVKDVVKISAEKIQLVQVTDPEGNNSDLIIRLSILCEGMELVTGGFDLYQREEVDIHIPPDFPYSVPTVKSCHFRFHGQPHVQWGKQLCLYQSKNIEWNSRNGMRGFIKRLLEFFIAGAKRELDAVGAPIHPPPVFWTSSDVRIIISKDAPNFEGSHYVGFAQLKKITEYLYELIEWHDEPKLEDGCVLATVLIFREKLPNEFPFKFRQFANSINYSQEITEIVFNLLKGMINVNLKSAPKVMMVGTPMRGIVGGEQKLHFAAWSFGKQIANDLIALTDSQAFKGKDQNRQKQDIQKFFDEQDIHWAQVYEDRPEIVVKRDYTSKVKSLKDKKICLIGVGAIGSYIAEVLVREGAENITIIDNAEVKPGIICRQNYEFQDVGKHKALIMRARLNRINQKSIITTYVIDFVKIVRSKDIDLESFDLVIDATASNLVTDIMANKNFVNQRFNLISIIINYNANFGLAISRPKDATLTGYDLYREVKLKLCKQDDMVDFKNAFWKSDKLFQPEPGCSDPTFSGSYSDIIEVINSTFKQVLTLSLESKLPGYILKNNEKIFSEILDAPEVFFEQIEKYEVMLSALAKKQFKYFIKDGQEKRGVKIETGGLIFGSIDNLNRKIYVDVLSDAPPDSEFSADEFVCGFQGVEAYADKINETTLGSTEFLGMWHTHPNSTAYPSEKDKKAVSKLLSLSKNPTKRQALICILRVSADHIDDPNFFFYEDNNG